MWSEHCSYKSSRVHLKTLPTTGIARAAGAGRERRRRRHRRRAGGSLQDRVAQPSVVHRAVPGRGDRRRRDHPRHLHDGRAADRAAQLAALRSARQPCRTAAFSKASSPASAATATASASRPSAARSPSTSRTAAIRSSTCSASASPDTRTSSRAPRAATGNPVYYVGAKTGRDGIHGATMASAEFDEKSQEKRPAVQVGDPFTEKLLLEACLEVMTTGALVGIQDMGAAGLTCSTSEMGSRGGVGIEIDVKHVPQRETGMTPYEIMLSESQERMLMVVKRGREHEVEDDLREVGPARRANRRGASGKHAGREGARAARGADPEPRADRRGAASTTGRRRGLTWLDEVRSARPGVARPSTRCRARRWRRCWRRRPSPASTGSTGSTTTWCARTRSCSPGLAAASCGSRARPARSRCRWTATAGSAT